MKIGICSYPMLYQRIGGAQVQLFETINELRKLGVDARHFDYLKDKVTDFDLMHVICTGQGNHKIVEAARQAGVPVVLSSIFIMPWSARDFRRARLAARLAGWLTRWKIHTEFDDFETAVEKADRVIALGRDEHSLLVDLFKKPPEQVLIVPNGVSPQFFTADGELGRSKLGFSEPFVLCAAAIRSFKGQLRLVDAAVADGFRLVLAGPVQDPAYFDECMRRGGDRVAYVGAIDHDDPLLASLYAAASLAALASDGEGSPVSLVECLATGTPFALTRNHSVELARDPQCWIDFDERDAAAIRHTISQMLHRQKPAQACRAMVEPFTWASVATDIFDLYKDILARRLPVSLIGTEPPNANANENAHNSNGLVRI